jgi:putative transposase
MIDRDHDLPITRQASLLGISRGSVYYLPRPTSEADLALMRRIDELHLEFTLHGCAHAASSTASPGRRRWAGATSSR